MNIKSIIYCILFFILINVSECIKTWKLKYPFSLTKDSSKLKSGRPKNFWSYWKVKLDSAKVRNIRKSRSLSAGPDFDTSDDIEYYDDSHLYLNRNYPIAGLFGSSFFYNPANAPYCKKNGNHKSNRPYKLIDYDYDTNPFNSAHGHIPKPPPEFRGSIFG